MVIQIQAKYRHRFAMRLLSNKNKKNSIFKEGVGISVFSSEHPTKNSSKCSVSPFTGKHL